MVTDPCPLLYKSGVKAAGTDVRSRFGRGAHEES
jgi:hypothetical protein